ncbi:MAG TPA: hypothetical protein VGD68_04025 [Streptosporangiaceae bacterium]
MRHFSGFLLAIVVALAIFFAGGWGYLRLLRVPAAHEALASLPAGGGSLLHDHRVLYAMAALAGTGLLIGLLMAVPRVSPLATGLPGLALLALTGLYLTRVHRAVQLIPLRTRPYGLGFEALLFNGLLTLLGLAMIIPLFVPSRWRRRRVAMAPEGAPAPASSGSGLLSGDTAVTQQGSYFPTQEFPATPGATQQHDPFPPVTNPYPPTQEQNPYSR